MNIATLNKQRKLIAIAAAVGIITIFLPWITISASLFDAGMSQSTNGFHGTGILVFLAFAAALCMTFIDDQTTTMPQGLWAITIISGLVALLFVVINLLKSNNQGFGFVEVKNGFGLYIALAASIGVVAFAWVFRTPGHTVMNSLESLKKEGLKINAVNETKDKPTVLTNKVEELEKLIDLKNKGHITEEEYQVMKSKLI